MMARLSLFLTTLATAGACLAEGTSTVTLEVRNMACQMCPVTVRKALEKVPGVAAAQVDFVTKQAVVAFDSGRTNTQALMKATAAAGFPSAVKQAP